MVIINHTVQTKPLEKKKQQQSPLFILDSEAFWETIRGKPAGTESVEDAKEDHINKPPQTAVQYCMTSKP